jgi:hypothetical protein
MDLEYEIGSIQTEKDNWCTHLVIWVKEIGSEKRTQIAV